MTLENLNISLPNTDDIILKQVGVITTLVNSGRKLDVDTVIEELKETRDYQNKKLTDENIDEIVKILKEKELLK